MTEEALKCAGQELTMSTDSHAMIGGRSVEHKKRLRFNEDVQGQSIAI
jgi:hypothetical protein